MTALTIVVAAHASAHPDRPLAGLADELCGEADQLDTFEVGDPLVNVRQVFSWSYERLGGAAARLFRTLGLHPGPDISVPAAASLAGFCPADARLALAELTGSNLLTEPVPRRFSLHDLLRAYAGELARSESPEPVRYAAVYRMLDHYLRSSSAAAEMLDPQRDLCGLDPAPAALPASSGPPASDARGYPPERPVDAQRALTWLITEHPVLTACVDLAVKAGFHTHAWHLAWTLPPFLDRRGYWHDWARTQTAALAAAEHLGDLPKQARSHRSLGGAYTQLARWAEAGRHLHCALEMYRTLHDQPGQAHTHLDIDWLYDRQGDTRTALEHAEKALGLFQAACHRAGQARALNNVGWHHIRLGALERGLDFCQQALVTYREDGNVWGEANAWDSVGYARHRLGHHTRAIDCYRNAVRLSREAGDRPSEAEALAHLGDASRAAGDLASARAAWGEALDILDALNLPDAADLRRKLASETG